MKKIRTKRLLICLIALAAAVCLFTVTAFAEGAEGEAEATRIYADSYSRNTGLFDFLRSMDAYRASMDKGGNIIVTDEDNEFFKYMK